MDRAEMADSTGQDSPDDTSDQTIIGRLPVPQEAPEEIGHFLIYHDGTKPIRLRIGPQGLTIGRTAPSDLQIAAPEISRRHCRIDLHGDWGILSDLGSTNGTFLAGARLERPARLVNGAQLSLGGFTMRYERRALSELADEEALSAELRLAEEYVRAILPQPITAGPVQASWWFVPSSQLGGDAFGYQFLDPENFIGFVLDVSGHGIGSAMHAANVANMLRRRALPDVSFHDPAQVVAALNDVVPMEEHNGLMLTIWYFSYHLPSRRLRFCAAGHHPAFLLAPALPEPAPLWERSPAIGMLPFAKWAVGETTVPPGGQICVFSDGAFEILTHDNQQWSLEDFRMLLMQHTQARAPEPERLYQAVRAASRPGPLDDDFSVLMIRFE